VYSAVPAVVQDSCFSLRLDGNAEMPQMNDADCGQLELSARKRFDGGLIGKAA